MSTPSKVSAVDPPAAQPVGAEAHAHAVVAWDHALSAFDDHLARLETWIEAGDELGDSVGEDEAFPAAPVWSLPASLPQPVPEGVRERADALLERAAACERELESDMVLLRAGIDEVPLRRQAATRYAIDGG